MNNKHNNYSLKMRLSLPPFNQMEKPEVTEANRHQCINSSNTNSNKQTNPQNSPRKKSHDDFRDENLFKQISSQINKKDEEDYLIKLHLSIPPYNKMRLSEAIKAIRQHCGYSVDENDSKKQLNNLFEQLCSRIDNKDQEDYLIKLHLSLPPYNKMERSDAIRAIRRHCGYSDEKL